MRDRTDHKARLADVDAALAKSPTFQLGRLNESIAAYDAALAIRPMSPPSLYMRGIARNRKCGCKNGDADIATAQKIHPQVGEEFTRAGITP